MSDCSKKTTNTEEILGCSNATDTGSGCSNATSTITDSTSNNSTSTSASTTNNSTINNSTITDSTSNVASNAIALPFIASITPQKMEAEALIGAADKVIDYVSPVIKKFEQLFGKLAAIKDVSYIETNLKLKQGIENKASQNALNKLLENYENENKNVTDVDILIKNLNKLHSEIDKILKMGSNMANQTGGKKIILRTNKSINQFLNPKITASNIKSKRKRYTNNKRYKTKTKRRNIK